MTGSQNPSPNLIQSQLPLESELAVESPFPPDSDRGRFPAQRRKRGGVNGSAGRKSITPKSAAKSSTTGTRTPAVAERSLSTPDSENQSMNQTADQSQKTNTPFSNQNTEPTANASSQGRQPPQPPKPGGTYWPEHKKRALAEAAQVALTTTNLNNDKSITTQEIHELLDQNPSYTQMCEILEHRGFVIDRGQFARLLLQAVPDLGSNSATRPPANAVTPTIVAPPAATANISGIVPPANSKAWSSVAASPTPQVLEYSASTPQSFSVTATQLTSANQNNQRPGLPRDYHLVDPAYWTPEERHHHASLTNTGAAAPAKHSVQWADKIGLPNMDTRAQTPNGAAQGPMQKQPTKQEMARKRSFAEIVDLTQALSDDEDLDRRRSKPRLDDETTFSLYNNEKSVKNVLQNLTQQHSSGTSTPTSVVDRPLDQTKQNLSEQDSILQSQDIVKPMNTRRDARRRSSYNPKTIARDILLAIGKHPTMTPLNGHLEPLRQRFSAVDNESDLSTFRWDIVDPPGDTAKGRRDVDEHDADGEDDGGVPTQRSPTRPCRAPVASTVGDGHGTVQAASSARPVPRSTRGRPSSRKVNPTRGGFSVPSFRSQTKSIGSINTPQQRTTQELASASGNGNSPSINPPDLSRYVYTSPYTGQSTTTGFGIVCPSVASSALASGLDVSKKRRGRPLGAKNSKPPQPGRDTGLGPKSAKTPDANLNNIVPSPISTPSTGGLIHHSFAAPSNTGAPSTSSAKVPAKPSYGPSLSSATTANANSAQPDSSNTTPARPSGLRNYISARTPADGIAVVISRSPSAAITPHKRSRSQTGRPRKVSNALSSGRRPPPSYQIYRCLWEKCPAELHNLETLQKHVRKHRRDEGGVYPCLWADCRDSRTTVSSPSPDIKRNRLKFESEVAWDTHVKAKHINSMARKLGDGPLTHPSGKSDCPILDLSRAVNNIPRCRIF